MTEFRVYGNTTFFVDCHAVFMKMARNDDIPALFSKIAHNDGTFTATKG